MTQEQKVLTVSDFEQIESAKSDPITLSDGKTYTPRESGKISPRQRVRAAAIMKEMYKAQVDAEGLQGNLDANLAKNNPKDVEALFDFPERMAALSIELARLALIDPPTEDELMDMPQDDIDVLQAFLLERLGSGTEQTPASPQPVT